MKIEQNKTTNTKIISFSNADIADFLLEKIQKEFDVSLADDYVNFRFEFLKEGSPEYNTDKIKCTVTIKRTLSK